MLRTYCRYAVQVGAAPSRRAPWSAGPPSGRGRAPAAQCFAARFVRPRPQPSRRAASERVPREPRRRCRASSTTACCAPSRSVVAATVRTNFFHRASTAGRARRRSRSRSTAPASPTCRGRGRSTRSTCTRPRMEGDPPARRQGRARRHPLERPARRLPHRGPRADEDADGEERGHRPGRRQGRLRRQGQRASPTTPSSTRTGRSSAPCSTSPTTSSTAASSRPPASSATTSPIPYLVVAADKGTATFSDVANEVAAEYGFWLGDAFASGGSHGYDHKKLGITARGAWECVARTSASSGRDADRDPFTVIGIGDMSGDVFGNGLLRSRTLRLRAAFNHRHVFLDPDPDPGGVVRRARAALRAAALELGRLPPRAPEPRAARSSRAAPRPIPLSPEARALLGLAARDRRRRPAGPRRPAHADRPALERRHRHLREGAGRDRRRGRRQRQRRGARQRAASCARRSSAKAATSASRSARASSTRSPAAASTPTPSTTRPASTCRTTR